MNTTSVVSPSPSPSSLPLHPTPFNHEQTQAKVDAARHHRHVGKLSEAVRGFEEALELEEDSDVIWGELALTHFQIWHQFVCQLHKPSMLQSPHSKHSADGFTQAPFGATILREAYNSFIVAMEYPGNKKNPALLVKMAVLYLEFQSYRGALSVCTLLVEGYSQSAVLHEAIFLCAVSAKAVGKHRESSQYFQYLVDKPPFRLASYHLHLLAALELEKVAGMRDHMRETYAQAYKAMIALSPVTASEKSAHQVYKTSHKNESQRVQMWFQDDGTWCDLATKLANLNFPLLVGDVLAVVRRRGHAMPKELLLVEGVSAYRVGEGERAVQALQEALEIEYWSDHTRFLLSTASDQWYSQFALEIASATSIQRSVRRHWLRKEWRTLARKVMDDKRRRAATVIQCAWRQRMARQQLAERRRERRERERRENERMATEDGLVILKQLNTAATKIQSLHKVFCAKQELRFRRALHLKHSHILESFAVHRSVTSKQRGFLNWRRFVDQQRQEREDAACSIQRQARCYLSRKIHKRLLQAKARQERIVLLCLDRRTTAVQRRVMQEWLTFLTLRQELKREAARRIQHVWRCHQGRKRYRHELRRHLLANETMHRMLSDKTAQMMRATWNALCSNAIWHRMHKYRSAVAIQRHARGLIARCYVRKLRSRRRRVAIVVNAMRERSAKQLLRVVFDGFVRFLEMQWELREAGATALQRIFRGYSSRKRVRFLKECNRILQEPGMSLRNKPDAYVLRVCFLLLARLPEQNRLEKYYAGVKIQKWYRRARKRQRLVTALHKLHRQRAILNTLQVNFKRMASLFFHELKQRVLAKRWRRDRMARRIQRTAKTWLTYRRYCRVLSKRELRKAKAAEHARKKQLVLLGRCLSEWHRVVRHDHESQVSAVVRIQRAYRTRLAKKQAQRELYKRAKRARLMESIQLKPLERRFKQWEACLVDKCILTVRAAAKTNGGALSPDKWRAAMKTAPAASSPQRHQLPVATLEQRAELPSLLFYTLLSRVRQSGILQLSFAGGLSGITTPQLQQLLGFASSVIVDGGGCGSALTTSAWRLVEHVVDAMATSARPCPAQKLIFYNASLSAMHAAALHSVLRHPDSAVTSLVLSNMQLSTSAVVSIATALCPGHSKLEQLVLEACAIGSAGGAAVAEALCHTRQLWKLDLSQNHIGDSACPALAQALVANESLRVLSLSGNAISDRGVLSHLAPALERAAAGTNRMGMGSNGGATSATSSSASRLESVVLRAMKRISPLGRVALQQATTRFAMAVHLD